MEAAEYALALRRGSKFDRTFTVTDDGDPFDFTGYEAVLTMRSTAAATPFATVSSHDELGDPITDGERIEFSAGAFRIYLPVSFIDALTVQEGLYDLSMIPPSGAEDAEDWLYGRLIVRQP